MKHSRGNLIATIIPIIVLVSVAASGWYFYNSRVNGLLEGESVRRAQLVSEKNSQEELAALLDKNVAEKMGIEITLQQEVKEAILITLGLESDLENLQITITEQLANESLLQAELILETNSKDELAALLEKALAEKMGIETALQQEAKETILNTIGLESELEKSQAEQNSLYEEITTVSGEKSQLLIQLEQEQKSK